MPASVDVGGCALCGGNLVALRSNQPQPAAAAAFQPSAPGQPNMEAVQQQAAQILEAIVPADLMEEMMGAAGGGSNSRPAWAEVLDALPLIKIEPYVILSIAPGSGDEGAASTPSRELLASAAERRAAASETDAAAAAPTKPTDKIEEQKEAKAKVEATASVTSIELRGTASSFGTPLADFAEGVSAPLVLAEPQDGASAFTNAAAVKGRVVLMVRGGCSFVDKIRRAQTAGATAAVVVQTAGQKWPFTMSDTAGKGVDLLLPSVMISADDGEELLKAYEQCREAGGSAAAGAAAAAAGAGAAVDVSDGSSASSVKAVAPSLAPSLSSTSPPPCLIAHARAHDHHTSCAVCLQEFQAEELAMKLPCTHLFHEDCVRTWLKKSITCPTCRKPLPPPPGSSGGDGARAEREPGDAADPRQYIAYPSSARSAPLPSSGMYT